MVDIENFSLHNNTAHVQSQVTHGDGCPLEWLSIESFAVRFLVSLVLGLGASAHGRLLNGSCKPQRFRCIEQRFPSEGISRNYLMAHYPSDVLVSVVLGTVFAFLGCALANLIKLPTVKKGKFER